MPCQPHVTGETDGGCVPFAVNGSKWGFGLGKDNVDLHSRYLHSTCGVFKFYRYSLNVFGLRIISGLISLGRQIHFQSVDLNLILSGERCLISPRPNGPHIRISLVSWYPIFGSEHPTKSLALIVHLYLLSLFRFDRSVS
jgi:hypothetical protein